MALANQTTPIEGRMVEAWLYDQDDEGGQVDITDETHARKVVDELLGTDRNVERFDMEQPGSWLVELSDDELTQLQENRWFGLDNDGRGLEVEWPDA